MFYVVSFLLYVGCFMVFLVQKIRVAHTIFEYTILLVVLLLLLLIQELLLMLVLVAIKELLLDIVGS